jgi:hypothetical protein
MIFPRGREWPSIAFEMVYTQNYDDLVHAATVLLEGSEGCIGLVILIKLYPLEDGENKIKTGFIELHGYDTKEGRRKKIGRVMVRSGLYFIPFSTNN